MNLPSLRDAPFLQELHRSGVALKFVQGLAAFVPGLIEGYLINKITAVSGEVPLLLWFELIIVACIHLLLVGVTFAVTSPLPTFLVEFDGLTNEVAKLNAEFVESEKFLTTMRASMLCVQACLEAIDDRSRGQRADEKGLLDEILKPWSELRTEIFWFSNGSAMYNMAIYLYRASGKLEVAVRFVDDRIPRRNRAWNPTEGHIGHCFHHNRTTFSHDTTEIKVTEMIPAAIEADKKHYKSMIVTPIKVNGTAVGVLIVNSSEANQFHKELHEPIVELMARLAGDMLSRGWTQSAKLVSLAETRKGT